MCKNPSLKQDSISVYFLYLEIHLLFFSAAVKLSLLQRLKLQGLF